MITNTSHYLIGGYSQINFGMLCYGLYAVSLLSKLGHKYACQNSNIKSNMPAQSYTVYYNINKLDQNSLIAHSAYIFQVYLHYMVSVKMIQHAY